MHADLRSCFHMVSACSADKCFSLFMPKCMLFTRSHPPLKIFRWPCFYLNITQVRSNTRSSQAFLYHKRQKAGWGLGTRPHSSSSHVEPRSHLLQCFEVLYHSWISQCSYSLIPNASPLVFIPIKANIVKN